MGRPGSKYSSGSLNNSGLPSSRRHSVTHAPCRYTSRAVSRRGCTMNARGSPLLPFRNQTQYGMEKRWFRSSMYLRSGGGRRRSWVIDVSHRSMVILFGMAVGWL